jgi:hypothetical protein
VADLTNKSGALSQSPLVTMYNSPMATKHMLDTLYLFQPRGPGTAFLFRMATPAVLVGRTNPRTQRPYGRMIQEGLGGIRHLVEARRRRDLRLGEIRREEAQAIGASGGTLEEALTIAAELRNVEDDQEREDIESALVDKADRDKALSRSSLNNLETAIKEFKAFAGEEVSLQEVDRKMVGRFVTEFLPNKKGPKAPEGQGPATIRKKVSQLAQVWVWAQKRGLLPYTKQTPWDEQGPSKKDVKAAAKQRRILEPAEAVKLLQAAPAGEALGDVVRVALLTGVRLEEVASL